MYTFEPGISVLSFESILENKARDEVVDKKDSFNEAPASLKGLDKPCKDVPLTPRRVGKL